jgi:Zn-dependent protease with chaperone function
MGRLVMCVFALLCAIWPTRGLAAPGDDPALERKIEEELAMVAPSAVETWRRANALREGQPAEALPLYEAIEQQAPRFDHAYRRHGGVLLRLNKIEEATRLVQKAYDLNHSAYNLAGLASVELAAGHEKEFREATRRLRDVDPANPQGHFFQALVAASDGSWNEAFDELDRAHQLGVVPDQAYQELRGKFQEARPFWYVWASPVGWALGGWLLGLVALLMVGLVLSALTLRACRRPVVARDGHVRGIDARLRRIYASVLWLCGAYFYVSMPLTVIAVIAFAAAVFLAMAAAGYVFFKLILLLGLAVIGTVIASLRSFFVKVKDEAPGDKLDLARHPRLRAVLEEVAARIGTRPVDAVYLVPGTDVAVIERGGAMKQLRGGSERCLILGVAVLREFPLSAFQAVLAHEYGHFVNRDTAGGRLALVVRHSLHAFANALVRAGAAGWYSPSWWFVVAYERIFLRISHGASRLQEVLADRWAATAYGAEAFEAGLRHVIAAEARFDAHVQAMINEKLPVGRLYRMVREADGQIMSSATALRFCRSASAYDSHPPPAERVAWVRALPLDGRVTASLPADAWSLFEEREVIERAMAELIRARAADRGVHLPIEEVAPSAA